MLCFLIQCDDVHNNVDFPSVESRRLSAKTINKMLAGPYSSIGCASAWYADYSLIDPDSRPAKISLWRFFLEIISTAILSLPLIQEEKLSVTGERVCTKYW